MGLNRGKQFEDQFKKDWLRTIPESFILRLPDQQSGYFGTSRNICDFITFANRTLFLIECKSHAGASIPFDCISQYDRLVSYSGARNIRCGVVIWLYDKDLVFYMPATTMKQMLADGKKSVGVRSFNEGYRLIKLPSDKIRVLMKTDYTPLLDLVDGD